ncbi:NUDIX domain-containing protein [Bacillus spongiae]|uniref:NUDIX domain-containing protein n=1 Tax=Bacillus spongiae TaxID=2683610 RepID=A0ABU8HFT2_9BACI
MNGHIRVRAGAVIIEHDSILLVEFHDENGLHYNLPAGGVEPNETVKEAVRREALEEASVDVEVGSIAFVYEYAPHENNFKYGETHSLQLLFECSMKEGSTARMPKTPDTNQTGVRWVPLTELNSIILYPNIRQQLIDYVGEKENINIIEEISLPEYR